MTKSLALAGASWLALCAATATAQTTITGVDDIDDRITDIEEIATDEIERADDPLRYGNPEDRPGFSGSASLSYSGKTGNNESQELSISTRLRYASGPWVQTLGVALDYAEDDVERTKEDALIVYDANYYFDDRFYMFGMARAEIDGLADTADDVETDAFVGFGPGYRIINQQDMTWRVQAGVGISYLRDGVGDSDTSEGVIASSRFFYRFSPDVFMTNDTDVLHANDALRVNNDLGVSFQMTDVLSTRLSYLTDYNEARAIRTDNRVSLAIVYGF
jgi:putative salt-induced outer membrane protein